MAASNSEEDENYWPGYVDALTTMTMVLTFIMMVLGVMVFVLSQDAISSKLGVLARALRIEARELERLNQSEIEDALRRAVAQKEPDPQKQDQEPITGNIGAPALKPTSLSRAAGAGTTAEQQAGPAAPFASTFKGGLQGEASAGPGGEYLITNEGTGVAGAERGTGARLEPGPGALRFVFERGSIDLPPAVAEALQAYVAAEGSGSLVIEASAVANEGGATEARRKAYFRAMLIRSRLISQGVDPLRIAVRVRDATQVSALETVDVMKSRTGG